MENDEKPINTFRHAVYCERCFCWDSGHALTKMTLGMRNGSSPHFNTKGASNLDEVLVPGIDDGLNLPRLSRKESSQTVDRFISGRNVNVRAQASGVRSLTVRIGDRAANAALDAEDTLGLFGRLSSSRGGDSLALFTRKDGTRVTLLHELEHFDDALTSGFSKFHPMPTMIKELRMELFVRNMAELTIDESEALFRRSQHWLKKSRKEIGVEHWDFLDDMQALSKHAESSF